MIDTMTQEPITVSKDGTAGPYIMVPLEQLKAVETVLRQHQFAFWVDSDAISLDGKPEIVVINLGRGVRADQIQQSLDAVN
jgi:hypothetical protein